VCCVADSVTTRGICTGDKSLPSVSATVRRGVSIGDDDPRHSVTTPMPGLAVITCTKTGKLTDKLYIVTHTWHCKDYNIKSANRKG